MSNKIVQQAEQINKQRKKYQPFEPYEVPVGVILINNYGDHKCIIQSVDNKGVWTTSKKYEFIIFKDLYNNWLLELHPGELMIAGAPSDIVI